MGKFEEHYTEAIEIDGGNLFCGWEKLHCIVDR